MFTSVTIAVELFELFKDKFLQDRIVLARNIARRLRDERVISQEIETEIMSATCDYDAASILYRHMTAQADKESAEKLFDIMINADGCHNMNALGQRMLDDLQNVSYLECTTQHIHMYMHLHVYLVSVHVHMHSLCYTFPNSLSIPPSLPPPLSLSLPFKLVRNPESTKTLSGHNDDIRQRHHGLHDRESRKVQQESIHVTMLCACT